MVEGYTDDGRDADFLDKMAQFQTSRRHPYASRDRVQTSKVGFFSNS